MGSGGPRGLQILLSGGSPVRGGFDSHTFPPFLVAALLALALACSWSTAHAQGMRGPAPWRPPADTLRTPAATPVPVRSQRGAPASAARDSLEQPRGFFRMPTGIMLRSLVIPGWGQASNGSWLKAGIVAGSEGALLVSLARDTHRLSELSGDDPEYGRIYDRRQRHTWWLGAVLLLSMTDAYVDAHLKSFEVDVEPEPTESGLSIALRATWP